MQKVPFVTKEKLDEIIRQYPTPFYIYDEKGIRENARALKEAFSWNKGFQEFFAVKANPNQFLINILREYRYGCDCSSLTVDFNEKMFHRLVDYATVYPDGRVVFTFRNRVEVSTEI